jgi:muramoyltetrapeptide carboxypeptidase
MKKTSKKAPLPGLHKVIYPPPIKKGDIIGLVAPAGSLSSKENFTAGIGLLEKKGFRVRFNRKILNASGYLAGSDQERADDFNSMWADPEVKALIAVRGGYGCLRMIDLIDMVQIRKNPKILIGFSDLTLLLNTINKKTKLVTFHGPVITTLADIDRQSKKSIVDTLLGQAPTRLKPAGLKIIKGGKAQGRLLGGNLTTLAHMIGTPYEIPWQDSILFIEDIGEKPYSLDRLLTHLNKAGGLQKIKGLILGTFTDEDKKERLVLQKTVQERTAELLQSVDIPIWGNFPTGHSRRNLILPVGVKVEMDAAASELLFLGNT